MGGQDGSYLAAHLLKLGYTVVGTSRDAQASRFEGLMRLGIRDRVTVESMSLVDFRSTMQVLSRTQPDEVYNLAGQTSVGLSFFVREVFASLGLDWRQHVVRDPALTRPSEIHSGHAATAHATAALEWTARSRMKDVARMMVETRLASQASTLRRAA